MDRHRTFWWTDTGHLVDRHRTFGEQTQDVWAEERSLPSRPSREYTGTCSMVVTIGSGKNRCRLVTPKDSLLLDKCRYCVYTLAITQDSLLQDKCRYCVYTLATTQNNLLKDKCLYYVYTLAITQDSLLQDKCRYCVYTLLIARDRSFMNRLEEYLYKHPID